MPPPPLSVTLTDEDLRELRRSYDDSRREADEEATILNKWQDLRDSRRSWP